MKKIYIIPTLNICKVEAQTILQGSERMNLNATGGKEDLVKSGSTSSSSYNVWDDDWSK